MINYRELFNPNYSYISIIIISFLIFLIVLNNRNTKKSIHQIGCICLISSIIMLGLSFLIKLLVNQMIPYQYKIFIQVISENFFTYSITLSIIGIALGIFLIAIAKFFFHTHDQEITISS